MLSGFFLYDEEKGGRKHGTLFLPKLRHADDKRTFRHRKRRGNSRDYCIYCYENGAYTHPDATLKDMIEICVPYIKEEGKTEAEARALLSRTLPYLKRWAAAQTEGGQGR
ncbi:zinc ribbon domain-containing protein [Bacillus licheniformis]|uniref:zinc ribbon domain-containing protein n=1 Tax=Bacillus licheniformis TaxID=1402 RepID=UPI0021BD9182|nr:zinc ribbon domain-containing protein [Bacillus licheniformis]